MKDLINEKLFSMQVIKKHFFIYCLLIFHTQSQASDNKVITVSNEYKEISVASGNMSYAIESISKLFNLNIVYLSDDTPNEQITGFQGHYSIKESIARVFPKHEIILSMIDPNTLLIQFKQDTLPPQITPSSTALNSQHIFEEVIVTGTRVSTRTIYESMSAIDTLSSSQFNSSEQPIDSLAANIPSYTAYRLPLSDGRIFNRSTSLRGLNSDHTLVLVNGKRRHRSAFVETEDGQSIDISHIPANAIKRIEVLKDGASAQYGSDAIAGVINIILKDDPTLTLQNQYSQYSQGDGEEYQLGLSGGWRDNSEEFATFSLFYSSNQQTSRSNQPQDAVAFSNAHPELTLPNPVQNWGQPKLQSVKSAVNFSSLINNIPIYGFGNMSFFQGSSDFNWRNPDTNSVFLDSQYFPHYQLADTYPVGFSPSFGQTENDVSLSIGIKPWQQSLWYVDLSGTFGENQIAYQLDNSINASLGPQSPTSFKPGTLSQREWGLDALINRSLIIHPNIPAVNIAAGLTWRQESYQIKSGDYASYAVGPAAIEGLPSGSNGFPGYSVEQAGKFSQNNISAYLDLDLPITNRWDINFAARYENYSLFSDIYRFKLASRYEFSSGMIRATISNGFRAPSAAQLFSQRTSQSLNADFDDITTNGRFSSLGEVATIVSMQDDINIQPLRPELATNISAGFGLQISEHMYATLDFYHIKVDDRVGFSNTYTLTDNTQQLLQERYPKSNYLIESVLFFQNIFDTRTQGADLIINYSHPLSKGTFSAKLMGSYNRTKVIDGKLKNDIISVTSQEHGLPYKRSNLSLHYQHLDFGITFNWRYWGEWQDQVEPDSNEFQTFSAIQFFDLSANYQLNKTINLTLGTENIFNTYPDRATFQQNRGLKYSRNSPYDTDGSLLFARITMTF